MLTLLMLLQVAPPPPRSAQLTRFLEQSVGLDTAQLAALERGEPVAKVLPSSGRDVALFGIVTVPRSRAAFTRAARRVPAALQTSQRILGLFSNPAVETDMAAFMIPRRDADALKDCKPGHCAIKLPALEMQRIRAQTDWSAPDLDAQLSAYGRRRIAQYVNDYRARGDSVMVAYDDKGNLTRRSSEAFEAQLAESPYIFGNVPSLSTYLTNYPRGSLPSSMEIIYWAVDSLPKLRPILSVAHYLVYTPAELPTVTIVATKLIYANHYFEAALDLQAAVDRGSGIYLLILRRLRFDNLPGTVLNIRGRVINGLREGLLQQLKWAQGT
jgi:hypothetical protein